jgi:hypothetical protein
MRLVLAIAAVCFGLLGMHALSAGHHTSGTASAAHSASEPLHAAGGQHITAHSPDLVPPVPPASWPAACDEPCQPVHGLVTACLFVLLALTGMLNHARGLATASGPAAGGSGVARWTWTVPVRPPSLSMLCISRT